MSRGGSWATASPDGCYAFSCIVAADQAAVLAVDAAADGGEARLSITAPQPPRLEKCVTKILRFGRHGGKVGLGAIYPWGGGRGTAHGCLM